MAIIRLPRSTLTGRRVRGGDASGERRAQAEDAAFYGQLAQAQHALKQGNVSEALALSAPLAQQSGERGTAAKLFRADVLRQNKDYSRRARQTLRGILNEQPQNAPARENLYYVLRDQNKTAEAQAMLNTLPAGLQAKLQPRVVTGTPGDPLRRRCTATGCCGEHGAGDQRITSGRGAPAGRPVVASRLARLLQQTGRERRRDRHDPHSGVTAQAPARCMPGRYLPVRMAAGSRPARCWRVSLRPVKTARCAILRSG